MLDLCRALRYAKDSHPWRLNKEYSCQGEHGISKEACNAKSGRVAPMFGSFAGGRSDPDGTSKRRKAIVGTVESLAD